MNTSKSGIIHYIYLLREREFIKTDENIYKIGKTTAPNLTRLSQYPNGSVLMFQMYCTNCHKIEKLLIHKFRAKYIHKSDIGHEYFQGNPNDMIADIYQEIREFDFPVCEKNYIHEFLKSFTVTNNPQDFITTEEIDAWILKEQIPCELFNFTKEMRKYTAINKFFNVMKIGNKWYGIHVGKADELYDSNSEEEEENIIISIAPEPEPEPEQPQQQKVLKKFDFSKFKCQS